MKIYPLYVSFRNVALPFRWKLYKPFFKCPVPPGVPVQPSVTSSQVTRTRDDHGVFKITPNMGTLPPNESVDFMLEFAPREVLKIITVIWSSVHTTPEEFPWKRSFIPTVISTVHTNPSWKRTTRWILLYLRNNFLGSLKDSSVLSSNGYNTDHIYLKLGFSLL